MRSLSWVLINPRLCYSYRRALKRRHSLSRLTIGLFCCLLLITALIFLYINFVKLELWPWYPRVEYWCDQKDVPEHLMHQSSNEITIVTMFLNLGIFKKGEELLAYHSPYKYRRWMRVLGHLANPVVAFFESDEDIVYFRSIRSCLPSNLTKAIKIHRRELSSFQHLSRIRDIYSQPSYPKIYPNTFYPEYSCAMSAKYDVIEKACFTNMFNTSLFAWLDIGLFRRLDGKLNTFFKLVPPANFKADKVAFTQAWPFFPDNPVKAIMLQKQVWVSGSMVLASKEKLMAFSQRYKEAVIELLHRNLSNTDQEVIHSMYTNEMRKTNQVMIKAYRCHQGQFNLKGPDARYFCLGYMCKDAWDKRVTH